jgi:hypothetical protein
MIVSSRLRALAGPVVALALLAAAVSTAVDQFGVYFGVDFYHLWGVGLAHRTVPGDPYSHIDEYSRALTGIAAVSPDKILPYTSKFREIIQPTGTPFFYAVFDVLPAGFDFGAALYYWFTFIVLVAGAYAMGRMRGLPRWAALSLGPLISMTFNAFIHDMANGNVTTLQMGVIVLVIAVTHYGLDERSKAIRLAYLPALALFVVFKPNTLPVGAMLALSYAVRFGARETLRGVVASAVACALAWLVGVVFFGDIAAWSHWYRYTQGWNGGTLLYNLDSGNLSLGMLISERSHVLGPYQSGVLLGAALLFFFFAAVTSLGKRMAGAVDATKRILADPWCAASIGVLIELAITPLMWPYYRMLALVPVFWLVWRRQRWDAATLWTALAYVMMSRQVVLALIEPALLPFHRLDNLLAWLPLVPAMCAALAREAAGARAPEVAK